MSHHFAVICSYSCDHNTPGRIRASTISVRLTGIGANDVANSFATSVGSQVLTLGQACTIALFTEFLGAVMLGANTTNTIRNGILNINDFAGRPDLLMYGRYCTVAVCMVLICMVVLSR